MEGSAEGGQLTRSPRGSETGVDLPATKSATGSNVVARQFGLNRGTVWAKTRQFSSLGRSVPHPHAHAALVELIQHFSDALGSCFGSFRTPEACQVVVALER